MPRVISDDLYERLMACVKQQRLLGVMGMLKEMQRDAVAVYSMLYDGEDIIPYGTEIIWIKEEHENTNYN